MAPQASAVVHVTQASKHETEGPVIRILSSRLFKPLALPVFFPVLMERVEQGITPPAK